MTIGRGVISRRSGCVRATGRRTAGMATGSRGLNESCRVLPRIPRSHDAVPEFVGAWASTEASSPCAESAVSSRREMVLPRTSSRAASREWWDRSRHRGPDDSGCWLDPQAGVSHWGHRRPRSSTSLLPATSRCPPETGRFQTRTTARSTTFSSCGRELSERRASLQRTSDTEVMLAAIAEWGVARHRSGASTACSRIALWDRDARRLHRSAIASA